jgi:methylmalonyl-CoA mutase, N-terminal domain
VDQFAPRLSFFFNAHLNFFEEMAKFRAARKIWAGIMKERFGARDPRSQMLRFHTQTAGCSLTAQQPMVNIMRVAYQALSACLGGTQSLHTNSYDEALALPSEEAALMALRTQQVVGYEAGRHRHRGSLGWLVLVIGVNKFVVQQDDPTDLLKMDPTVAERQEEKLKKLREERQGQQVAETLKKLRSAAQTDENLMPLILDAVKAYATIGEICDVLREVFGEFQQQVLL